MKLKAAIYCRLSKEDMDKGGKVKESESIINQTMMLLDFVKQQGFRLYEVYKDDDYSGLFDDRPGFERLIEDARTGKFQIVVAKTQSRFTRNMEHLEKYLHHDFPIWGIRFIGMVDNSDTANKGNKKARQINGLVNEWYCEDLSENIKASYRIKQKNGQFLGAAPPYGYIKDPENRHVLKPDPYAAEIVNRIFSMYLLGIGKSRIARILTDEGILIPTEYKRRVLRINYHNAHETDRTTGWTLPTIDTILKNQVYIGNLIQNKCGVISYKDRKKVRFPESQWIKVENTHPPIVDKEIFQSAQNELKKRTCNVNIGEKKTIFASVIFCGDCGTRMTPNYTKYNKQGLRSRHYLCGLYKKYGNRYCTSHIIDEQTLSQIVLENLKKNASLLIDEKGRAKLIQLNNLWGGKIHNERIKGIEIEISKAEKYREKAFENYADGIISKEDYMALKAKYDTKVSNLSDEIATLKNSSSAGADEFHRWLKQFTDNMSVDELTREMVLSFIEKIEIFSHSKIKITYKFNSNSKNLS